MASLSVSRSGRRLERECTVRLRDVGPNRWQHRVVGGECSAGRLQGAVRSALHGVEAGRNVFLLDGQERWCILKSSLLFPWDYVLQCLHICLSRSSRISKKNALSNTSHSRYKVLGISLKSAWAHHHPIRQWRNYQHRIITQFFRPVCLLSSIIFYVLSLNNFFLRKDTSLEFYQFLSKLQIP